MLVLAVTQFILDTSCTVLGVGTGLSRGNPWGGITLVLGVRCDSQDIPGMHCWDVIVWYIAAGHPLTLSPLEAGCELYPAYHAKGGFNSLYGRVGGHTTRTDSDNAPCVAWCCRAYLLQACATT